MATVHKTKFGHMACLGCGEKVVIRENAAGTITGTCQECGLQHQARKHEGCYTGMLKRITRDASASAPPAPAPVAKPSPAAKTAPAPTMANTPVSKKNTIFG